MPYNVFTIHISGAVTMTVSQKAPTLEEMQKAVGGYIETIPHFTKYKGHTRGLAYCNEDGIAKGLPFNKPASDAWKESLGYTPATAHKFSYEPHLRGDVLFYAKAKRDK